MPCPQWAGRPLTEDLVLTEQLVASASDTRSPVPHAGPQAEPTQHGKLHDIVLEQLDDDGALDIVSIDLAGKSSEADHMVIVSGRSSRHVGAIADKLIDRLKHDGGVIARAEGLETADWVLIDAGDVIVHVFRPEVREFYQLEKMWMPAPEVTARAAVAQ